MGYEGFFHMKNHYNKQENLSDSQRHVILDHIIKSGAMSRRETISYLEFFIRRSERQNNMSDSEIQKELSKAGFTNDIIQFVASIAVKNLTAKNGKQQTYRDIISKYGQNKGLSI